MNFDKFRKIFWMIISIIFIFWLFLFLWNSSTQIYRKEYGSGILFTKVNRITGNISINLLLVDKSDPKSPLKSSGWKKIEKIDKSNEK